MSNPGDQEFERLTQLLAFKRHEEPPPGYFNDFPDRVIARIEAELAAPPAPFWRRLLGLARARPLLASAYGTLAASVTLFGLGVWQLFRSPSDAGDAMVVLAPSWNGVLVNPAPAVGVETSAFSGPPGIDPYQDRRPPSFLFDGSGNHKAVSVSYQNP